MSFLRRLRTGAELWGPVGALFLAGVPSPAAGQEGLAISRIFASEELAARVPAPRWMSDGVHWTVVEADSLERDELWRVEAETGRRDKLISAVELIDPGTGESLSIESHSFSAGGEGVLIFSHAQQVWRGRTKGRYYVFDLPSRRLQEVSREDGWQMFAKFSPDGGRVAFVRDHDLHVTDLATGTERRLTFDGSETIINGTTDWVYEEELDLRDAFRWSPDGRRIAYWQLDQSPIPVYYLVDQRPLYPELTGIRYPKAGERNSLVRVGSLELATGRTTWFDVGLETDLYIPRMDWAASSDEVVIQRLNRSQNRLDLLLGDALSGRTILLFSEQDEAWVDANDDLLWLDGGERFTWTSDRDGFTHLYLYDRSGRMIRQLTRGSWDVTRFHGVDEVAGEAFFSAAVESPVRRSVYAVSLEESQVRQLAGGSGTHSARFSPDYRFFVHTASSIGVPPVTTLSRSADGGAVRVLEENAQLAAELEALDLRQPEFFTVRADDGAALNAWIMKPRDFDPAGRHPVLLYVYGGPGSQTVRDAWGGARYLWHQLLVQKGILVASVDNRGTGARGRAFRKQVYRRLGQLETADQLAAVRQLAALPFVDHSRVGIWGWSYGGYMALMTALTGGPAIAAAIAGAPVTAWELYDTIYTERFMGTPRENPEGYRRGAPLTHASGLHADLLIVHGTADDNVHPQNTFRMIDELEAAGKHFDMRLYPGQRHGIRGPTLTVNLYEMMTDFLLRTLAPEADEAPRRTLLLGR